MNAFPFALALTTIFSLGCGPLHGPPGPGEMLSGVATGKVELHPGEVKRFAFQAQWRSGRGQNLVNATMSSDPRRNLYAVTRLIFVLPDGSERFDEGTSDLALSGDVSCMASTCVMTASGAVEFEDTRPETAEQEVMVSDWYVGIGVATDGARLSGFTITYPDQDAGASTSK